MKKIFFICLLFLSIKALGQSQPYYTIYNYGNAFQRLAASTSFLMPLKDTTMLTDSTRAGSITMQPGTFDVYVYNGTYWEAVGGQGGGAYTASTGIAISAANAISAHLSTGVSGGQAGIGGTGAGENLTLSSTSNGTKGKLIVESGTSLFALSADGTSGFFGRSGNSIDKVIAGTAYETWGTSAGQEMLSIFGTLGFCSATTSAVAADASLTRISAGVLGVGTGAVGSYAGSLMVSTVIGGTGASENLTLSSTSNATKGLVISDSRVLAPASTSTSTGPNFAFNDVANSNTVTGFDYCFPCLSVPSIVVKLNTSNAIVFSGGAYGNYTRSDATWGFTSSNNCYGTLPDAAISRISAGVISVGNGTAGNFSGSLMASTIVGGTGASDVLTFKSTTGNQTSGDAYVWTGGNNGANTLMSMSFNGSLTTKTINVSGGTLGPFSFGQWLIRESSKWDFNKYWWCRRIVVSTRGDAGCIGRESWIKCA